MTPRPGAAGRGVGGPRPTVVVVGGGIAGLAAAWELSGGSERPGGAEPRTANPDVVVLEAGEELGGKLQTEHIGEAMVDVGPDGFLSRRTEATELCREVGLGDALEPIAASGAAIWARGRARTLPTGLALGVPTRFWPVARSGILGWRGALRLLVDVVAPRPDLRGPLGDRAIGPLVARKLGQRVVDTLVDPLVGGIHAGGVADMSAAALYPLLIAAAQQRGSFMRALRRASLGSGSGSGSSSSASADLAGATEPAFWALRGGMATLVERLVERLEGRGVEIRPRTPVTGLDLDVTGGGRPWTLSTPDGEIAADGVVLGVPAGVAGSLLAPHDAEAAGRLQGIDYASVGVVTLAFPADAFSQDLPGTGLLVPRGAEAPADVAGDRRFLVTACTYLSSKWPHLGQPGLVLLRASVGRFGDDRPESLDDRSLVERVVRELRVLVGVAGEPTVTHVTRWPEALPQYRVHHLLRVSAVESGLRRLPPVAVAGSAYQGVGIPACVGSGRAAGQAVLEALQGASNEVGRPG